MVAGLLIGVIGNAGFICDRYLFFIFLVGMVMMGMQRRWCWDGCSR